MTRPTAGRLAAAMAIPGGLLIAGVWLTLWAFRCRHRSWTERPNEEGHIIRICERCGEEVDG